MAFAAHTQATPLLALKEAQNCGGCHNPGRGQRPLLQRRCTLDCQGCHIDPNGAGPRNQWGYYYEQDQLPAITFFKPQDPLQDDSRFDVHVDSRLMQRRVGESQRSFPMNTELSLRLRPFVSWLHLTYQLNLLGRSRHKQISTSQEQGKMHYQEKFSVMVNDLPLNLYVRAARGIPLYGIRRPNHSSWIRERIGLSQFDITDSVSIGGTPTVPFVHYSQILGNPLLPPEDRQKGTSFHGGMRGVTLGWHVNTSFWHTRSAKAAVDMQAFGGGANIFDFVVMAEKNFRKVTPFDLSLGELLSYESRALRIHPSSSIGELTVSYTGVDGLIVGWQEETLEDEKTVSKRRSLFVDLHPIPYLQMEFWRRFETGSRKLTDNLLIVHLYGDF